MHSSLGANREKKRQRTKHNVSRTAGCEYDAYVHSYCVAALVSLSSINPSAHLRPIDFVRFCSQQHVLCNRVFLRALSLSHAHILFFVGHYLMCKIIIYYFSSSRFFERNRNIFHSRAIAIDSFFSYIRISLIIHKTTAATETATVAAATAAAAATIILRQAMAQTATAMYKCVYNKLATNNGHQHFYIHIFYNLQSFVWSVFSGACLSCVFRFVLISFACSLFRQLHLHLSCLGYKMILWLCLFPCFVPHSCCLCYTYL